MSTTARVLRALRLVKTCAPRSWCSDRCWRASARRIPAGWRAIGARPVNLILRGPAGQAQTSTSTVDIAMRAPGGGARLNLQNRHVTGTENLMMAATLADGDDVNAARELEVVYLAKFHRQGAKIRARQWGSSSRASRNCAPELGCSPTASRAAPTGGRRDHLRHGALEDRSPNISTPRRRSCAKPAPRWESANW